MSTSCWPSLHAGRSAWPTSSGSACSAACCALKLRLGRSADPAQASASAAAAVGPITAFLSTLTLSFQRRVRERVLLRTQQLVVGNSFDAHVFGGAARN